MMEGNLGSVDLQTKSFFGFREIGKLIEPNASAPVNDWTIVDFDNFLRGNPHV